MARCTPFSRLVEIAAAVAAFYRIPPEALTGRDRRGRVVVARMVALHLTRTITGTTLEAIGGYYGRDHTTVGHAVTAVERRVKAGTELAAQVAFIERELRRREPWGAGPGKEKAPDPPGAFSGRPDRVRRGHYRPAAGRRERAN